MSEKILSMIDVAGSEANFQKYKSTVEKTLPAFMQNEKERYWMMYAKIATEFICNPKITDKRSILTCMFNAVKLGLNSGMVSNVRSGLVYENDNWKYFEDEVGQHYRFEPNFTSARGKELFGYSIFTDNKGRPNVHVMESSHIDNIKKMVLARTPKSPWADKLFEPEMRKKTVIRRHWKTEPMSVEIAHAIDHEEAYERGEVLQVKHPELDGIMDELIEKATLQTEEDPLSVFDDPKKCEVK